MRARAGCDAVWAVTAPGSSVTVLTSLFNSRIFSKSRLGLGGMQDALAVVLVVAGGVGALLKLLCGTKVPQGGAAWQCLHLELRYPHGSFSSGALCALFCQTMESPEPLGS